MPWAVLSSKIDILVEFLQKIAQDEKSTRNVPKLEVTPSVRNALSMGVFRLSKCRNSVLTK